MILHQNIREIYDKIGEFLNLITPNAPEVICLTEHHLRTEEIRNVNFSHSTRKSGYNTYRGWTQIGCQDRHRKEEGTWDGRRRDGGTNSTLRIKEQEKHLTFNEHDDDDDDEILVSIL
jgi:hypothetical protein